MTDIFLILGGLVALSLVFDLVDHFFEPPDFDHRCKFFHTTKPRW